MRSEEDYSLLAKGNLEKIALPDSKITHKPTGKSPVVKMQSVPDHTIGMQVVLAMLTDPKDGVIFNFDEIDAVGHRIVQGADFFDGSVVVDEDVMEKIKICCDFAPLHNPAHILGIRAMQSVLPKVPQVVVFDTAFHQTMAPKNYMYALPYEYYEKYRVRRYGAHGTSHQYVSREGAKVAGLDINNSRIITCHIGNGSSVTAIKNGKVVDTSMGFTPLEGLVMGTRSGDIDPAIVTYIREKEHLDQGVANEILNKKSGVLGISGVSSDFRDLAAAAEEGNERAELALEVFAYRVAKYVGSYVAAMNGVDNIVFTAGIGENDPSTRARICKYLGYLGIEINEEMNGKRGEEMIISTPDSKVTVLVIPTNEELAIARETVALV